MGKHVSPPEAALSIVNAWPDMSPADRVKILLVRDGRSMSHLAESVHYNPNNLSSMLAGRRQSRPLRRAIAHEFGVPVSDIWPDHHESSITDPAES